MADDPIDLIAEAADTAPTAPDMTIGADGEEAGDYLDDGHLAQLMKDCPVTPLGHLKKDLHFLDVEGQHIVMNTKFDKGDINYLFGDRIGWLVAAFPQYKQIQGEKGEKPVSVPDGFNFNQAKVQRAMIRACRRKGFFEISGKLRGRGSHRGPDGELMLHCGNAVVVGGMKGANGRLKPIATLKPGEIGKLIFSTAPALPKPADKPATADMGRRLTMLLDRWNWQSVSTIPLGAYSVRIEAVIVLGWLACAKLCGAIGWRPHMWLVGPSGSGKTTLQKIIAGLLADWALESDDPSEAWISQRLMDQRLPVLYDEPEPDADGNSFVKKVILLARLASSGGKKGRGSADHKAMDFVAYSCFLFSSILHHELDEQDRNRMAIPKLSPFPPNTARLDIGRALNDLGLKGSLTEIGLALTRRLIEQWPRYDQTLLAYQAELMKQGFNQREQDTYGQLLCGADMLMYDGAPDAMDISEDEYRCTTLAKALKPMISVARAEAQDTSSRCLDHLATHRLPAARGAHQESVSRWVHKAVVQLLMREHGNTEAKMKLMTHGMKLVHCDKPDGDSGAVDAELGPTEKKLYVAVAYKTHKSMAEIFTGSTWSGGLWTQALGALPHAITGGKQVRFDGLKCRSVLVPIDALIDVFAAAADADRERGVIAEAEANKDGGGR